MVVHRLQAAAPMWYLRAGQGQPWCQLTWLEAAARAWAQESVDPYTSHVRQDSVDHYRPFGLLTFRCVMRAALPLLRVS